MGGYKSLTKEQLSEKVEQLQQRVTELEDKQHPNPNREELTTIYADTLLNSLIDIVFILHPDATIRMIKDAAKNILGYSEEELIGKPFGSIIEEEDCIASQLDENFVGHVEKTLITKDGRKVPVLYSGSVIKNSSGEIERLIYVGKDITKQKQEESALIQEKEKWYSVIDNAADIIINLNLDKKIQFINHVVEGFSREEVIGMNHIDFILPQYHDEVRSCIKQVIASGKPGSYEIQGTGPSGSTAFYSSRVSPLRQAGQIVGVTIIATDITDRKKAEEALQSREKILKAMLDATSDMVYMTDVEGNIVEINKIASQRLGKSRNDVIGTNIFSYFPPDLAKARMKQHREIICTKQAVRFQSERQGMYFNTQAYPTFNTKGVVDRIVVFVRDITENKLAEEELKKAYWAIETSLTAIFTADHEGKVVYANSAAAKMWGFADTHEMLGKSVLEYWDQASQKDAKEIISILSKKGLYSGEGLIGKRRDGTTFIVEINAALIKDAHENPIGMTGSFNDITERKRAEEMLQEDEKRFRLLYEKSPIPYQSLNEQGVIIEVNHAWLNTLQYSREEVVGHWFGEFLPEDMREVFKERFTVFKKVGTILGIEFEMVCKDGTYKIVSFDGRISHNDQGLFRQTHCVFSDITIRKQAEDALKKANDKLEKRVEERTKELKEANKKLLQKITESERLDQEIIKSEEIYRTLVETSPDAIAVLGLDTVIHKTNSQTIALFGYESPEDLIGKTGLELVAPQERDRALNLIETLLELGSLKNIEITLMKSDETTFIAEINASLICYPTDNIKSIMIVCKDITDRKQAEEALQEKERLSSLLMNSLPHPALIIRKDRTVVAANRVALKMGSKVGGYCWLDFCQSKYIPENDKRYINSYHNIPPGGTHCTFCLADKALAKQGNVNNPCINIFDRFWDIHWIALNKEEYLNYAIDITDRKEFEKQLQEENRRKDEFLALLGHELRNPLAPIVNAIEIISLAEDNPKIRSEMLEISKRQTSHLVRLVDDLLDISRITRGKIKLQKDNVSLKKIIDDIIQADKILIDETKFHLNILLPKDPVYVYADATRLKQVVSNILNNAVKFTPNGGTISLEGKVIDETVEIRIKDTGIGIPENMLPDKIFENFTQADLSSSRTHGGLGLGLALSKKLIEMHNGTIEAFSAGKDQGSEFLIRLPVAKTNQNSSLP